MLNLFGKLTTKKTILFSIILFILMAGVVVLYIFRLINELVFTISLFILIMLFSSLTSSIIHKRVQKRLENKKKGKPYTVINPVEFNNPLKRIKTNYGKVDLYLEDKVFYSLIIVRDSDAFFSENQQQIKFNIDQKKYDKLIQFYIFGEKDINLFRKISIINYQAKNFYVGSFILDDTNKVFYQTDYIEPNEDYKEIYDNFIKLLNINN